MYYETVRVLIEWVAGGIELLAVTIIVAATAVSFAFYIVHSLKRTDGAYRLLKTRIGKALMLALELLVAADIIKTIVLEPTLVNVTSLGILVLIRTFLNWSLTVEVEGSWPWRQKSRRNEQDEGAV